MFRFKIGNLMDPDDMAALMDGKKADLIYTDPPWSNSLITQFYNKADVQGKPEIGALLGAVVKTVIEHGKDQYCIEMGTLGAKALRIAILSTDGELGNYTTYNLIYGKHQRCFLYHGGKVPFRCGNPDQFLELRKQKIVEAALLAFTEEGDIVLDFCMGLGMTARACHETNRVCYGLELSSGRMARTIEWCIKKNVPFEEIM